MYTDTTSVCIPSVDGIQLQGYILHPAVFRRCKTADTAAVGSQPPPADGATSVGSGRRGRTWMSGAVRTGGDRLLPRCGCSLARAPSTRLIRTPCPRLRLRRSSRCDTAAESESDLVRRGKPPNSSFFFRQLAPACALAPGSLLPGHR